MVFKIFRPATHYQVGEHSSLKGKKYALTGVLCLSVSCCNLVSTYDPKPTFHACSRMSAFQVCSREVITGAVRSKRSFARPVKLHFKLGECPLLAHLTDPKSSG